MTDAQDVFHSRRAQLTQAAEHWQRKLAYGDSNGWEGDRALVLYHAPLTDEIEVWYELPNTKPVLVFKVPAEGFDIHRVTSMLRDADHRRRSNEEIIADADAHNDAVIAETEAVKAETMAAANEKLGWAIRKDTGQHISPLHVTSNPVRPESDRMAP